MPSPLVVGGVDGASEVREKIAQSARDTLERYPIAASLLRADVASHLNTLPPHAATVFPLASSGVVDHPSLSDVHARLAILDRVFAAEPVAQAERAWADRQVAVANSLIHRELVQGGTANHIRFSNVPYRLPKETSIATASLPPATAMSRQAEAIRFPYPSAAPYGRSASDVAHAPLLDSPLDFFAEHLRATLSSAQLEEQRRCHSASPSRFSFPSSATSAQTLTIGGEGSHRQASSAVSTPVKPKRGPARNATSVQTSPFSPDPLAMGVQFHFNGRDGVAKKLDFGVIPSVNAQPVPPALKKRKSGLESSTSFSSSTVSSTTPKKPRMKVEVIIPSPKKSSPTKRFVHWDGTTSDALSRLNDFIEDLLEADDMLNGSMESSSLMSPSKSPDGTAYFFPSPLRPRDSLLSPVQSKKLIRLVEKLKRNSGGAEAFASISTGDLSRVLKILERNIKAAEEVVAVPGEIVSKARKRYQSKPKAESRTNKKGKSKATTKAKVNVTPKKRQGSSPNDEEEDVGANSPVFSEVGEEFEVDESDLLGSSRELLKANLDVVLGGIMASDATLTIMTAAKLPKQLYSEELITSIVTLIKSQLQGVVYPFMEATSDTTDGYMAFLRSALAIPNFSDVVSNLFQAMAIVVPKLGTLVDQEDLSESVVVQAAYISIGPFFIQSSSSTTSAKGSKTESVGQSQMRVLRLAGLSLLRTVVSQYPDQRDWIVDEILTSVTKLSDLKSNRPQYLLSDGKHIYTFSALLLHLIQTSTSGSRKKLMSKLKGSSQTNFEFESQEFQTQQQNELDENVQVALAEVADLAVNQAQRLGKKVVLFLLQKSGKGSKGTSEADYRLVLDHFMNDLLQILYDPEWPASELILQICCRSMFAILDDTKQSADINAAKGLCLDYLGPLVARLLRPLPANAKLLFEPFQKILVGGDMEQLERVVQLQKDIIHTLDSHPSLTTESKCAVDLMLVHWVSEALRGLHSINSLLEKFTKEEESQEEYSALQDCKSQLSIAIQELISSSARNQPTSSNVEILAVVKSELERFSRCQGLRASANVFFDHILGSAASSSVTFRSKAIRAIGLVLAEDSSIIERDNVKRSIENRMLDSSPAVRDAAVELVGKYIGNRPDLALLYLPQIAARIADKGLSVRKRVVKMLKDIYHLLPEDFEAAKIDICRRLISRVYDEDDRIKDLAMDSIEELWFSKAADSTDLRKKSIVIMTVIKAYKEKPSPLEEALKHIFKKYDGNVASSAALKKRCEDVANVLIEEWLDVTPEARDIAFNEVDCIKTIYVMTASTSATLTADKATMLLPFLRSTTSAEEQAISECLLRIFRSCISDMPKTAGAKFGETLQGILIQLLNKPNLAGGGAILQETVACFSAVVLHQTHDYTKLLNVFKACEVRMRTEINKLRNPATASTVNVKAMPLLVYMVSSFVEHGEFDKIRQENKTVDIEVQKISKEPIHRHVFEQLTDLYHLVANTAIRSLVLSCLGFIYRSYPTLMTETPSTMIMDEILISPNIELRSRLLRTFADFLTSQSIKGTAEDEKGGSEYVDMNQLIGNTENFADSGVGLAVVQRYMSKIAEAALSPNVTLQKPAVDIISFTIKQGLAHPIACVPVLVSLESSPDESTASKALGLHNILHTKRPELVHTRFIETAKKVWEHQCSAAGTNVNGYREPGSRSVFASWYNLVCQRRPWRLDFIKSLVKCFNFDSNLTDATKDDVHFARFLGEALVSLDFKTQEEVFVLVACISTSLALFAHQTLHYIQGDDLMNFLRSSSGGKTVGQNGGDDKHEKMASPAVARASLILSIGMITRDHIKFLYSLTDTKCNKFALASGKKCKIGDLTTTRRNDVGLVLSFEEKIPFLNHDIESEDQVKKQGEAFADLISRDVTLKDENENGNEDGEGEGEDHGQRTLSRDDVDDAEVEEMVLTQVR